MFFLSCCLGRSQKSDTSNDDQPLENDISNPPDLEASSAFKEIEPKLPSNSAAPRRTRTNDSNKSGKKSRSSVLSWCSVTSVVNFCHTLKSSQTSYPMEECPPTIECSSPTPAADPRTKFGEISSNMSLTIQEEGEDQFYNRRQSYSDDPFAPPTPRVARFGSFSTSSQADCSTLRSSVQSNHTEPIHLNASHIEDPVLTLPDSVCLPNIDRLSKFDFNEWNSKWMKNSPVIQPYPVRNYTMASTRMSPSPTLTYRPQHFTRRVSDPTTLGSRTNYSSRTEDSTQIPFPQL
ncbi:hypothetical protein PtA15_17A294 [Puccinia triticina]|uniref:Uncharacterized protein n=1 Tax=Puccinia triticina TaxID=208348 RepID=A0ABY7D823_9BASI|nr:uncharacterized protein PtA15_17A294 [Puccinia triticina]WAQ92812.1 hypothetical protein PtA15_17A294 [Puccinia triticina]WAR63710.1 hypothetical protein PtB15_17B311 [Puccinia triticina]